MLTSFIFSYFLLSSLYICRERSTNPPLFIQNKPNFQKSQMNLNKVLTRDYENARLHRSPKRTQNEPNSKPIYEMPKMNVCSFTTKDYGKNSPGWLPKTNPKQTQFHPHFSIFIFLYCVLVHWRPYGNWIFSAFSQSFAADGYSLSSTKVTGPSLTLLTCICPPNTPFSTATPRWLISAISFS